MFGNSGSGKSTHARERAARLGCPHLDLDTLAWSPDAETPTRRPLEDSRSEILRFIDAQEDWVVEGCYADLLEVAISRATEIVFLNPGIETCVENARRRPWEPHKYATLEAQDANLGMLVEWIREYGRRTDECSYAAHRRLFDAYAGPKQELASNERSRHLA